MATTLERTNVDRVRRLTHAIVIAAGAIGLSVGSASAVQWTNTGADNLYTNAANWTGSNIPDTNTEDAEVNLGGANKAILSSGSFTVRALRVGTGAGLTGVFDVTGGSINADATTQDRVGSGNGGNGTVNQSGGTVRLAGSQVQIGLDLNATGVYNLSGGSLVMARETGGTTLFLGQNGNGTINITGGAFTTRGGVELGIGTGVGTFRVVGNAATQIGIGSEGPTIDGRWIQHAASRLQVGITSGGITPILVDEKDAAATGNGNVTFDAGSILDPFDAGGAAANMWHTVMTWEGTLTNNGLALSTAAQTAGWSFRVEGNSLQVQLVAAVPEPTTVGLAGMAALALLTRRRRS